MCDLPGHGGARRHKAGNLSAFARDGYLLTTFNKVEQMPEFVPRLYDSD